MSRSRHASVAIPSWNGRHHLETCLEALRDQRDPGVPWEVLVLDNGSRDGTAAWARAHHPQVRVIESSVNLGFAAGCNRLAREASGDVVVFLNNDTRPRTEWLAALVDALRTAPMDVAAVSGLIVDWEGRRLDFARGLMTFDGHAFQRDLGRHLELVEIPPSGEELLFPCGGNMLVRRASFLAAGGFDEEFFAYYEDVDLGWRLWAGGERVVFAREAVVHHRSGATSGRLGAYNRGFLFERNAFLTAYNNYEAGLWERMMPAVMLTLLSRTRALLVGNNPGGAGLDLDPFAGHIADTARGTAGGAGETAPRRHAAAGLLRLGARTARRWARRPTPPPSVVDGRTQAQFRAIGSILRHLDAAAVRRAWIQARRRRPDREIFARFPLALVPTYPGDDALFGSPGFQAWLPPDLPLTRLRLDEVMDV
jgi:GT2 family glycosyltransferase